MKKHNVQNNNTAINQIKPNSLKINQIALIARNYNTNDDFIIDFEKIVLYGFKLRS